MRWLKVCGGGAKKENLFGRERIRIVGHVGKI